MEDIFVPKKTVGVNDTSKNIKNIYRKKSNLIDFLKIMQKILILYRRFISK